MRDGLRRGARECGDTEGFPREVAKTTLQERVFIVKLVRQFERTCPLHRVVLSDVSSCVRLCVWIKGCLSLRAFAFFSSSWSRAGCH